MPDDLGELAADTLRAALRREGLDLGAADRARLAGELARFLAEARSITDGVPTATEPQTIAVFTSDSDGS
jgi:hypothetical protein